MLALTPTHVLYKHAGGSHKSKKRARDMRRDMRNGGEAGAMGSIDASPVSQLNVSEARFGHAAKIFAHAFADSVQSSDSPGLLERSSFSK